MRAHPELAFLKLATVACLFMTAGCKPTHPASEVAAAAPAVTAPSPDCAASAALALAKKLYSQEIEAHLDQDALVFARQTDLSLESVSRAGQDPSTNKTLCKALLRVRFPDWVAAEVIQPESTKDLIAGTPTIVFSPDYRSATVPVDFDAAPADDGMHLTVTSAGYDTLAAFVAQTSTSAANLARVNKASADLGAASSATSSPRVIVVVSTPGHVQSDALGSLSSLVGMHPGNALSQPAIGSALRALVGNDYPALNNRLTGPGSMLQVRDGYLFGSACIAHNCGGTEGGYAIFVATGETYAAIQADDGSIKLYGAPDVEAMPPPMRDFIAAMQ